MDINNIILFNERYDIEDKLGRDSTANSFHHNMLTKFLEGGKIVAHQGFDGEYPGNSLPAFNSAFAFGSTKVECDVQITADKIIILSHDTVLSDYGLSSTNIIDTNYVNIASLVRTSGRNISRFTDLRVCTLDEYLRIGDYYNYNYVIDIGDTFNIDNINYLIEKCLPYYDRCLFISKNADLLNEIKKAGDTLTELYQTTNIDIDLLISESLENNFDFVGFPYPSASSEVVEKIHNAGLLTNAFTFSGTVSAATVNALGVDIITCASPSNMMDVNQEETISNTRVPRFSIMDGVTATTKAHADRMNGEGFVWMNNKSPYSFPLNYSTGANNRAVKWKRYWFNNGIAGHHLSFSATPGFRYSFYECRKNGSYIRESGWLDSSYSTPYYQPVSSECSFVIVLGSRSDNSVLDYEDLLTMDGDIFEVF